MRDSARKLIGLTGLDYNDWLLETWLRKCVTLATAALSRADLNIR